MSSPLYTSACELLGVQLPIVQTGMGWVAGARLAAATSEAGGLGVLAAATMTTPQLAKQIAELKQRTDKPFGVNLRADAADLDQRIQLLIDEGVKVASFAGAPAKGACSASRLRACSPCPRSAPAVMRRRCSTGGQI